MGFLDAISAGLDVQRVYEMAKERSLDEIQEILSAEEIVTSIGTPEIKKGLLGRSIKFPKVSRITPVLTVKGTKVVIKKETDSSSTSVSVGGIRVAGKGLKSSDIEEGGEYFSRLCDAVRIVLEGK